MLISSVIFFISLTDTQLFRYKSILQKIADTPKSTAPSPSKAPSTPAKAKASSGLA
jgi:hypothetical protein